MVYEIKCSGCDASYVGQTVRHLTTRMREDVAETTPIDNHMKHGFNLLPRDTVKIIDKYGTQNNLLTLEALYIAKRKPTLNTRKEYRQRELTLRT